MSESLGRDHESQSSTPESGEVSFVTPEHFRGGVSDTVEYINAQILAVQSDPSLSDDEKKSRTDEINGMRKAVEFLTNSTFVRASTDFSIGQFEDTLRAQQQESSEQ